MLGANRYDRFTEAEADYARDRDLYSYDTDRTDGASFEADDYSFRYSDRRSDRYGAREQDRYSYRYSDRNSDPDADRYGDSRYESEKMRTSEADRDRLMNSLERRAARSRTERTDESRYSFMAVNADAADNNFDRMWDRKHATESPKEKKVFNKKSLPFVIAYFVLAIVAVVGVTLSLVDFSTKTVSTAKMASKGTPLSASAENVEESDVSASEAPVEKIGGETYVMLKNGELAKIKIPQISQKTKEEEKGFDKFCTWLNEKFGG